MAMDQSFFQEMEARIPKGKVRTRFAPSPTGYMHVGNLRTALYTWLIARHAGGTFILRIEDTDQGRLVEGATDVIYRTMAECGLTHDEGPDVGGPVGPYIQSERRDLYQPYAHLLVEKGAAYYCFCEKTESEEDSGDFDRGGRPLPVPGPRRGPAPGGGRGALCDPAEDPPRGHHHLPRRVLRRHHRGEQDPGRPGAAEAGRPAHLQLRQRGGRPPHGHHPRGPGQRVPVLRPQVQPALRGLRLGDPHLRPLLPRHAGPAQQDVQAPRGPLLRGPEGPGLSDGGHFELCGPAGLGPQGGAERAGDLLPV